MTDPHSGNLAGKRASGPQATGDTSHEPRVRKIGAPEPVPVYNCMLIVSPRDANGCIRARVANLAQVVAEADTERQALQLAVTRFKAKVAEYQQAQQPIPWLDPPETPLPHEQMRWIAVHL